MNSLRFLPALWLLMGITACNAFALPSGITGRTLKPGSSPGCALKGCHAGLQEAAIVIKAPSVLAANQVARCTVLVLGMNTGVNISVTDGSLSPVLRLLAINGELTHPSSGTGIYVFDYTAPASPGTETIFATGLSGGKAGPWGFASDKMVYVDLIADRKEVPAPLSFALEQNYPNPFNPTTTIQYTIGGVVAPSGAKGPVSMNVKLSVYDLLGREVAVLVNERRAAGSYQDIFDGNGLASGVYVYRLIAGEAIETKRMVLLE
jgi:hypothetical protein